MDVNTRKLLNQAIKRVGGLKIENMNSDWMIPRDLDQGAAAFGLKIMGNDMQPYFNHNDDILIIEQQTLNNGDIGVILLDWDHTTIKKYYRSESGFMLVPLSQKFEPFFVTHKTAEERHMQIIGKVVMMQRRYF